MEFSTTFQAARTELAASLEKRRLEAETALTRATADFETWLDAERLGKSGARPDPMAIVRRVTVAAIAPSPEAQAEIGRLEAELAAANQRAAAAFRDRDAAVAHAQQAIAMRDDSVRRVTEKATAAAEPGALGVATPWEARARRAGWFLLVAAELPGLVNDLSKSAVPEFYFFFTFLMWLSGAALLGIAMYAKQKRRPDRKAALFRTIALGAIAVIAVPTFFDLVSKSQAGPLPYTLASAVVMLGGFGLALIGASVVALVRRRQLSAKEPGPSVISSPVTGKVSR
jgi:hypothetical protein